MQDSFVTQTAQAPMAVDNLDLLPDNNVAEDREEREHGRHCGFPVDDQERDVVDLQAIREVVDAGATFVRVSDDHDFVPSVNQLR